MSAIHTGVAISTEIAVPTAGQMYSLLCTVYKEDAIADIKTLEWIGPDGNTLTTDDSITIVGPTDGDDLKYHWDAVIYIPILFACS